MVIRGVLLDIQGVLFEEGTIFPGAVEAFEDIVAQGYSLRCLTNNTKKPRRIIVEDMKEMGFSSVSQEMLFTPVIAACRLMEKEGIRKIHLATKPEMQEEFSDFELTDQKPDAVVVGDLYREFTFDRLNDIYQLVRNGAKLIALHKNRYCVRETGIGLNLGPFVVALEYASDTKAAVVGKPNRTFFEMALTDMKLPANHVVMVGDDIEADVGGGHGAGMIALQVETGKFQQKDKRHSTITPDAWLASVQGLPAWLERNRRG